ncbi:aldo/keto reductase [Laceyella sacchari]|uniref:Aldo/keto reductase n=1 Tax=Laceyella sacchari TaxID=37482 RepID=A0ABY5U875_LACSH|nr:aldo/keto reductase [Laceyella sacchari]UWE04233.1 aldo/keto reductase [Laceyella sacchari]
MVKKITDTAILNNGVLIPWLGIGLWKVYEEEEVVNTIKSAVQIGYRSIDTAANYKNEESVGKAIKKVDVSRNELFITTKVWNIHQGYESTLNAFEESRKKLDLEYIDLFLIHWPVKGKYKETWKALEKLYKEGFVRAIGVSNFQEHHLQDLLKDCQVKPMVNQVEFHPYLTQKSLHTFCKEHNIQLEAWSPLMKGKVVNIPQIKTLAKKYNKTCAQIVLRWNIQLGVVTIPKSVNKDRIKENADLFDFNLDQIDIDLLNNLNRDYRIGPDPDNFDL